MSWLQNKFENNFMITTVDYAFNWARKSALWSMIFGLACCAVDILSKSLRQARTQGAERNALL